ncbi:chemotaxis protein CheW [Sporosarcina sp. P21c]|uniref:chemotaxis protein CheW n=1 Tax=unclassified Sporosarcina TaxID=2647733 RepID=UPI000C171DB7|nr:MULTISPECIES: chemotaxis protein CheW [unclassified Sporosarcina]PIC84477.1 chemotaxis protein CheW [Sporosarcina sp. P1]PIC91066.1 chemotaxis protein CheW [Sporosarcina sp. P21c]
MTKVTEVSEMKVIVFQLMNKEYAIGLDVVESIEKSLSITRVPRMPSYVKGVLNLRGVVTPVVDLRERFDMEYKEFDETSCIIIVSHAGAEVGLIVDDANDVMDVPTSSIGPQPEVVGSVESEFISGVAKVGKRLLVMLNLEKVLQPIKKGNTDEF